MRKEPPRRESGSRQDRKERRLPGLHPACERRRFVGRGRRQTARTPPGGRGAKGGGDACQTNAAAPALIEALAPAHAGTANVVTVSATRRRLPRVGITAASMCHRPEQSQQL